MLFSDFFLYDLILAVFLTLFLPLSLSACLSFIVLSAYCPYFLLLMFLPVLGRSSISSSLSLSGQVGRCYRRSLGQFYLTWPISSNISGNSLFGLRREHSCIDGKALNFFSSPSLSHLSIPPTHPPLSLSLSLSLSSHPQILKRWISCLGMDAPLPLGSTNNLPLPGEYVCVCE